MTDTPDITLRQARLEDAAAVFRMQGALAQQIGEGDLFKASLADVERDAFGPAPLYDTLLAELEDKLAGLMTTFMTYSTYSGSPALFVDNLFVEDWARGRGVGRLLMARASAMAEARGCVRVDLEVREDNPARGFYRSIGMVEKSDVLCTLNGGALRTLAEEDETP